jgi:hypothetical protein
VTPSFEKSKCLWAMRMGLENSRFLPYPYASKELYTGFSLEATTLMKTVREYGFSNKTEKSADRIIIMQIEYSFKK